MSGALRPPRPWPLDAAGRPKRRVAVSGDRGVYWRPDGLLEVGYRDADGRLRWRGPFETITAARAERGDARAKARSGERESGQPAAEVRRGRGSLAGRAGRRTPASHTGDRRQRRR